MSRSMASTSSAVVLRVRLLIDPTRPALGSLQAMEAELKDLEQQAIREDKSHFGCLCISCTTIMRRRFHVI